MKILVTLYKGESTFFTPRVRKELEKLGEVVYNPYERNFTKEELKSEIKGIDVVFTGWGSVSYDEEVLQNANSLKLVAHVGGTVSPIQSNALMESDIIVLSGNRIYAKSVAEGTVCYMLIGLRRILEETDEMRNNGWWETLRYTNGLWKKNVGLIGFGMIAQNVAKLLRPFDVNLKIHSSYLTHEEAEKYGAKVTSMDEIFETCDVISVHSGLNEKNYHSIDKKYLTKMKDGALLVNTARGAIINEEDLADELKKSRISAVLDVYETEPLPLNSALRNLPNAILIPHKGGPTIDVRELVTLDLIDDVKRYFSGNKDLKNIISSEYAARMTNERMVKRG